MSDKIAPWDRKPWHDNWRVKVSQSRPSGYAHDEETWVETDRHDGEKNYDSPTVSLSGGSVGEQSEWFALISAAPDLVRSILAIGEWSGRAHLDWMGPGDDPVPCCPWCGGLPMDWATDYEDRKRGHTPRCSRQAALRKAGVIE